MTRGNSRPGTGIEPARRRIRAAQRREPAMGIFTKDIHTLEDLFDHQLKDIEAKRAG